MMISTNVLCSWWVGIGSMRRSAPATSDLQLGSLQVSLVQQLIIIIKVMMIKVIMIMVRLLVVMMISIKMNIIKSAPTTSDLQSRSLLYNTW